MVVDLDLLDNVVRRRLVWRTAQLADVVFEGALFGVLFVFDAVAFTVAPATALGALDQQLVFFVALLAYDAQAHTEIK